MTPEERAAVILKQVTMIPRGRWDADVVEFETRQMGSDEFAGLIAAQIRAAIAETREACASKAAEWALHTCKSHDDDPCCHARTGLAIAAAISARA